jgi:hypothetical protein
MNGLLLCDLDGTLCDIRHRLHFVRSEPKDWEAFHQACSEDKVVWGVAKLLGAWSRSGGTVVLLSGRSASAKGKTISWLYHHGIAYHQLHLRPVGNFEHDWEFKQRFITQYPPSPLTMVLEDRQRVVEMWRSHGYLCLQPNHDSY